MSNPDSYTAQPWPLAACSASDLMELAIERLIEDPSAAPSIDEIRQSLSTPATDRPLTIAEAATLTGVGAHTLRYYERAGLIEIPRDDVGNRRFDEATVQRVIFLARMRASGMPIQLLQRYIALVDDDSEASRAERLQIMQRHRAELARHVAELQIALAVTDYKIAVYSGSPLPADLEESR